MASDKDADKVNSKAQKDGDAPEGGAEGEAQAKKAGLIGKLLSKKMLMFVVAPVALLLVAGGAYFFLFVGGEEATAEGGEHGEGAQVAAEAHPVFFEVPDILVNVSAGEGKPAFLKLAVSLELDGHDETAAAAIEPVMPKIVDQLQTYLRELRIEDLSGSAAMFRLKEELLRRVNLAVEPVKVKNVLFREMIIQ